ncbi:hypothetical protein QBC32DRAFT_191424, partial [Pseudoneurospora amorphoporcata]
LNSYLGGEALLAHYTIASNGKSLSTTDVLIDSGANGNIFVSKTFANKLIEDLRIEQLRRFEPHAVGGYDGQYSEIIQRYLRGTLQVQNRILPGEVIIVVNLGYDLILGKYWL